MKYTDVHTKTFNVGGYIANEFWWIHSCVTITKMKILKNFIILHSSLKSHPILYSDPQQPQTSVHMASSRMSYHEQVYSLCGWNLSLVPRVGSFCWAIFHHLMSLCGLNLISLKWDWASTHPVKCHLTFFSYIQNVQISA